MKIKQFIYPAFILMGLTSTVLISSDPLPPMEASYKAPIQSNLINPLSSFVTTENHEKLNSVGNFKLDDHIKPNNISKAVTKIQFEKKEYFLALASQAEGFTEKIYQDNRGFAIGNGWNLSHQSIQDNQQLALAVFDNPAFIHMVSHMSVESDNKKKDMSKLSEIKITPQKSMQITYLLGEKIKEKVVLKGLSQTLEKDRGLTEKQSDKLAIKLFKNLKKNEQDAIIYHAYKLGKKGFLRYKNMISGLINYAEKKGDKQAVINELSYMYKLNGKKIEDNNAQELVTSMFVSPEKFAQSSNIKMVSYKPK